MEFIMAAWLQQRTHHIPASSHWDTNSTMASLGCPLRAVQLHLACCLEQGWHSWIFAEWMTDGLPCTHSPLSPRLYLPLYKPVALKGTVISPRGAWKFVGTYLLRTLGTVGRWQKRQEFCNTWNSSGKEEFPRVPLVFERLTRHWQRWRPGFNDLIYNTGVSKLQSEGQIQPTICFRK